LTASLKEAKMDGETTILGPHLVDNQEVGGQMQGESTTAGDSTGQATDSGIGTNDASLTQQGQSQQGGQEQAGTNQATEPKLPGFTAAATKELRSDPRFIAWASKFKSFDDAVKSALELESKMGTMVAIPGEDATPEQKAEFYKRLGVPEKPEEYELPEIDGLEYDEEAIAEFKGLAKELNLTKEQAKKFYEYAASKSKAIQEQAAQQMEENEAKRKAEKEAVISTLKKEWGDDFEPNQQILKRGFANYATPSLIKKINDTGLGNDVDLVKLFYELGKTVMEDPGAHSRTTSYGEDGTPRLEYPGI